MPDGRRRRRHSTITTKRLWYAFHRSVRFRRRFGLGCQPPRPATLFAGLAAPPAAGDPLSLSA